MSIKFPPVILGPEMAAALLWAPGIFWLLLENPHAHNILLLGEGGVLGFFLEGGGGVEVPILFLWARFFFPSHPFSARTLASTFPRLPIQILYQVVRIVNLVQDSLN